MSPDVRPASGNDVGKTCSHCDAPLALGVPCILCPTCLSPQHAGCWNDAGEACASYFCAPETARVEEDLQPEIVITREETDSPPPPPRPLPPRPTPSPIPEKTDAVATAALGLGLIALPLGFTMVGALAVLLAAVSLGRINASGHLRGKGRAWAGLGLGLLASVAWVGIGIVYFQTKGRQFRDSPFLTAQEMPVPPSPRYLQQVPPHVRRALSANVFIQAQAGMNRWVGSGIVIKATSTSIWVLTNRHVADGEPAQDGVTLKVQTVHTRKPSAARVLWRADGGIDIALLEVAFPGADERVSVARCASTSKIPAIGSHVFAVGNPHSLAWTYTEGAVSSIREHSQAGQVLTFIQTQTPINPGNSGGGLYDREGNLVGMNTWKISHNVGEGLGFAVSVPSILAQRADLIQIGPPAAEGPK